MPLLKPKPKVKVITHSKETGMKRRHEVQIIEGREEGDEISIQRYENKEDAKTHADILREAISWTP